MAEAKQIAVLDGKKLKINLENFIKILEEVGERPLAIISINGPKRTGKSYMLGHFLRYLNRLEDQDWFKTDLKKEFLWENSSKPQTIGIWAWSEPFMVKSQGREVAVLLLDTQGCFDDKTTMSENAMIFALSSMLSSTLIYNLKNQLSEDVLQFLCLFISHAKMSNTQHQEDDKSLSKLILLIRDWESMDFPFGYHDDTSPVGQSNFKREILNVKDSMAQEVQDAHRSILSLS